MAVRPVYIAKKGTIGVEIINIEFNWFPGFSVQQKQKSIESLHSTIKKEKDIELLEVSSKSQVDLGIKLSAFNLSFFTKRNKKISVESAFQGSKVFENGGPYIDLLEKTSKEAKQDERIRNSGKLKMFKLLNKEFDINPKTFFYDWLYINTLNQINNKELVKDVLFYEAFTDIEFNPKKSINCQAYSLALFVSLINNNMLEKALESKESFLNILSKEYNYPKNITSQGKLF